MRATPSKGESTEHSRSCNHISIKSLHSLNLSARAHPKFGKWKLQGKWPFNQGIVSHRVCKQAQHAHADQHAPSTLGPPAGVGPYPSKTMGDNGEIHEATHHNVPILLDHSSVSFQVVSMHSFEWRYSFHGTG